MPEKETSASRPRRRGRPPKETATPVPSPVDSPEPDMPEAPEEQSQKWNIDVDKLLHYAAKLHLAGGLHNNQHFALHMIRDSFGVKVEEASKLIQSKISI